MLVAIIALLIGAVSSAELGDCNEYWNEGPLTLEQGKEVDTVTPSEYFEIAFDIEFNSLCNNPTGKWGYDAVCGVLQIGGTSNNLGERYPMLFIVNEDPGNSENYWYTRLQTSSAEVCCGEQINFLEELELTSTGQRHHVYVAMTPNTYTVNIDGSEQTLNFATNRYIPSQDLPVYFDGVAERPSDAELYNICIRSSSSSLYDPCDGVVCNTQNPCSYSECIEGDCIENNYSLGHSCADNNKCNGDEACDDAGQCQEGISINCDDANICTDDDCDEDTGDCSHIAVMGRLCLNGDVCDGEEVCDVNGVCQAGEPKECQFGEECQSPDGKCVADCNVFGIDDYMQQCSSIPGGNELQFAELREDIADLHKRINNLKVESQIIERTEDENVTPIISLDIINKDMVIIALLLINMFLFLYICYYAQIKRNKSKYKKIAVYSSEEDKPINNRI